MTRHLSLFATALSLLCLPALSGCGGSKQKAAKKSPASCPARNAPAPKPSHWWQKPSD